jgi:hypothetical protein
MGVGMVRLWGEEGDYLALEVRELDELLQDSFAVVLVLLL